MPSKIIRNPQAAGRFYPATPAQLKEQISRYFDKNAAKKDVIACMLPHAGYIYSGKVACSVVSGINIKQKVILLGPNHTGYGEPFSIMTEGAWETPLGRVEIDSGLAKDLLRNSKYLKDDALAHVYEHSLEVELPILQYVKTDFKIGPIVFMSDDTEALKNIGDEISERLRALGYKDSSLLVASSDMTHYEPKKTAEQKDKQAIEAILELNEDRLAERVRLMNITMCGYAPVIVMVRAAKILGAKIAKLIAYQTSGDVTGDNDSVVGYAGITIS
ncbi:MAG: AmmeMemoRadiSam system protein B [Candidatus Omnitrophica bacterium]|nr:AmmeMemoRadiSam system protein B [Candidatus Omnitrophota bacterium]